MASDERPNGRGRPNGSDRPSDDERGRLELLWGLREPPRRGPKRALTLRQIAGVCVRIADTEGLGAISMQRVAGELDYTKMSLYRYVRSKAELLAVTTDLAIGDPPDLGPPTDHWRVRLDRWARLIRATWQRHPWLPHVSEWQGSPGAVRPVTERAMGPNEVGWVESGAGTLDGLGLTAQERLDTVFLVSAHLRATQAMSTYGVLPWTLSSTSSTGSAGSTGSADVGERLRADREGDYPALAALAATPHDPEHSAFEFGLTLILDGIELLVDARAGAGRQGA